MRKLLKKLHAQTDAADKEGSVDHKAFDQKGLDKIVGSLKLPQATLEGTRI